MLAEILRRREVRAVTWFHTDHWEPWSKGVNDASLKRVDGFVRQARTSLLASKMTLFYLTGNGYRVKNPLPPRLAGEPEEILLAQPRSEAENKNVRDILGRLRAETGIEFQLHVHHEDLVGNDGDWGTVHRHIKGLTDPQQDARRLHFL